MICACKELGIRTVAIYSEADRNSLQYDLPTRPSALDRRSSAQSYLNIPAVISAAEIANVDAIHPGYGLLSRTQILRRSARLAASSSLGLRRKSFA